MIFIFSIVDTLYLTKGKPSCFFGNNGGFFCEKQNFSSQNVCFLKL